MAQNLDQKIEQIRNAIDDYPDFPKPGILFRDIFSVLKTPSAFKLLHEICVEHIKKIYPKIEVIVGLESRGFLFGPMLALEFEIPFIPIRKKGKLPGKVHSVTYALEYGQDSLEIQYDSLKDGTRVLIIDDLIATGGSMAAACHLLNNAGVEIVECLCIMELTEFVGRSKFDFPFHSFIKY